MGRSYEEDGIKAQSVVEGIRVQDIAEFVVQSLTTQ